MKFAAERPYADPEKAARKLIEIANSVEAIQDGRIHIEKINWPFLQSGGSADEYVAGLQTAIDRGWLDIHRSGTYVKFTQAGAAICSCRTSHRPFRTSLSAMRTARRPAAGVAAGLRTPNPALRTYLNSMRKTAFEPCIPTRGTKVPAGKDWLHEIKHDGYRLIVQREGDDARLFTRNGHDWTHRYPLIVEAALRNRAKSFVIDGEAVLLGVDGISDFNGLHSRRHDGEVQLYAFDILALEGDDLRRLPLSLRKTNLARLLARRPEGIFVSDFEQGDIGPDLFRAACSFGLEGIVSKRRDSTYRAGRSPNWIKVKNRTHSALNRVKDAFA